MFILEEVENEKFVKVAASFFDKGKSPLLAMFAVDENAYNNSYMLYAVFSSRFLPKKMAVIATRLNNNTFEYPSLTKEIPAANWYEREIYDLFGLKAIGHPNLEPLVLHGPFPLNFFPLRKQERTLVNQISNKKESKIKTDSQLEEGLFHVPVGPIHAGIIEPGNFCFTQDGEDILSLEAKLFFTHRGIEKSTEGMNYQRAVLNAERICGNCTVSHAFSFSRAVENLTKIEIPYRAELLRIFLAELERLYNHIGDIGNMCAGAGWSVGVSHGARLKEKLMSLNEWLTGSRYLRGMIIPGGLSKDIKTVFINEAMEKLKEVFQDWQELSNIIRYNDAFLNRTNGTGILKKETAIQLSVVGVAAKATGIPSDMRKEQPYSLYKEFDFQVPVYESGDATARLFVRNDEIIQSMMILQQIAERLPNDNNQEIFVKLPEIEPYKMSIGWSESARGGNIHVLVSGENNTVYRYFVRSASYANWPCLPHTMRGNIIPDFPIINKSFELCYACIDR